ncbi:hypothetical protein [Methylobacillus flagellatus]|uniref:hypothetical protein n=1 Tax=Methylobacillus flagellatus TaxID=405 RepID=UPI000662A4B9|nr:hypothetical protein [Methylobacillus flagellatus]
MVSTMSFYFLPGIDQSFTIQLELLVAKALLTFLMIKPLEHHLHGLQDGDTQSEALRLETFSLTAFLLPIFSAAQAASILFSFQNRRSPLPGNSMVYSTMMGTMSYFLFRGSLS